MWLWRIVTPRKLRKVTLVVLAAWTAVALTHSHLESQQGIGIPIQVPVQAPFWDP